LCQHRDRHPQRQCQSPRSLDVSCCVKLGHFLSVPVSFGSSRSLLRSRRVGRSGAREHA
jgi:hypothetical protein